MQPPGQQEQAAGKGQQGQGGAEAPQNDGNADSQGYYNGDVQ